MEGQGFDDDYQAFRKGPIRMVVCNLQGKLLQKMIVLPLFTFTELHEIGVQIEDAMKQGLIADEKEQPKRPFTCSSNATTSGSTTARPSDMNVVTMTPKTTYPFANTNPQTSTSQARSQRVFTLLYMPLSKALGVVYITPSHLPKPIVFIPESMNLCMMNISTLQLEPTVVTMAEGEKLALEENASPLLESSTDVSEGLYDPVLLYCASGSSQTRSGITKGSGAQELGAVSTADTEQEATLKQFVRERDQDKQEARIARHPTGNVSIERMISLELDNCSSIARGAWWEEDDLCLAHTDEDWGEDLLDNTWYSEKIDHMTRSRRSWLHQVKAVSSTLHQMLKYHHGKVVAIVLGNSSVHPLPEVTTLVLEIVHGKEDVFFSRFTLAEARAVQPILAADEGLYVSAQSIYFMNKLQHMTGMGLGRSGQKDVTVLADVPHNLHAFGLGYTPTKEDWVKKGKEMVSRARAKQTWKHYELVQRPIWGTLNGHFVWEGEDFSFYGFPEPWVNSEKQRIPNFEIFFDLQLQDSDTKERVETIIAEAERSIESDFDNGELEVGAALACPLSDPPIDSESLGDNLIVSVIGDQPVSQNLTPRIPWSRNQISVLLSPSPVFLGSVVTEELDELDLVNEIATTDSEYFSMPLVYCIDPDFQNFDENEEEGIPLVFKNLINREKERFTKPLADEIIAFNIGTEKDRRLVQFEFMLSSEKYEHLVALLKDFKDVFTWSYEDIPGIDPKIRIRPDWALKIKEEVTKQIDTGFLLVSEYPTWLANIVLMPKKDDRIRVCVDFRDLNRASPKDNFPLPHIDESVDFTSGHALLSFIDGFSGYNQILMAPEDREKIVFTTS
ncbi:hypothetical protein HYC85_030803 [Camellia sinensis]|uniref:Transposon Ty3-I Gag-Pol polyprotein n=1 Tax=Camellia sinensis TaxID=4442 RepID=A0A7J7G1T7_CAMSI|nr:hypothetical protein HYC85_030803 [Camellia sinensis]